jgi:hypothetical protein
MTKHFLPNLTTILAVKFGAKTPASNAPTDTTSIRTESAAKSKLHANNSIPKKESARNVIKDTQLSMANVLKSIKAPQTTLDAPNGKTECALNAQRDGTSMLTRCVFKSATSAHPGTNKLEPALNATMGLLWLKESVLLTKTSS